MTGVTVGSGNICCLRASIAWWLYWAKDVFSITCGILIFNRNSSSFQSCTSNRMCSTPWWLQCSIWESDQWREAFLIVLHAKQVTEVMNLSQVNKLTTSWNFSWIVLLGKYYGVKHLKSAALVFMGYDNDNYNLFAFLFIYFAAEWSEAECVWRISFSCSVFLHCF